MLHKPSCSHVRDGKAMLLLPQEGGRIPDKGIPYRMSIDKDWKAPAAAQESGRNPEYCHSIEEPP